MKDIIDKHKEKITWMKEKVPSMDKLCFRLRLFKELPKDITYDVDIEIPYSDKIFDIDNADYFKHIEIDDEASEDILGNLLIQLKSDMIWKEHPNDSEIKEVLLLNDSDLETFHYYYHLIAISLKCYMFVKFNPHDIYIVDI